MLECKLDKEDLITLLKGVLLEDGLKKEILAFYKSVLRGNQWDERRLKKLPEMQLWIMYLDIRGKKKMTCYYYRDD